MWDWIEKAHELKSEGQVFAIATIVSCKGSSPRDPGAKILVLPSGEFFGTIGGGNLEQMLISEVQEALVSSQNQNFSESSYPLCMKTGQCCGGAVEAVIEVIGVSPKVYLFGAGHVAQSVAQTLDGTPFQVHLIDERDDWIFHPSLPSSTIAHKVPWEDFVKNAEWNRKDVFAVVMTHDHKIDLEIIADISQRSANYIGLIGSETKWGRFQQRLRALGIDDDAIGRVHCPIGLPIGGKAPREVAVSLSAQLLKAHYDLSEGTTMNHSRE